MRRVLGGTAALALAFSGSALAFAVTDYQGNVKGEPLSSLGFNVDHNANGKRVATGFVMGNLDYTCDTAPAGSSGGYTSHRRFRVRHAKFSLKQNITEGGFDPVLTMTGRLLGGGKAKGTLRLKGKLDPGHPSARCDTGTVHWKAERTAQPG
jgi:hypothetical protein